MKLFLKKKGPFQLSALLITLLIMSNLGAAEKGAEIEYVQIEPIIVTNYQKKSSKKPGFVQISAQLTVKGSKSVSKLLDHMPLVRDYIIEFLSFTDESIIKDVTKRRELRASLSAGIKATLTKHLGEPLIEELIITHFMWD
ncbi:MAG: hypothetical protein COA74_10250 [Gammaproteobacteria bacterium]|nr:MAG: hypothetical protein COA74_10250 [Gammaproteobacteria bacterium]